MDQNISTHQSLSEPNIPPDSESDAASLAHTIEMLHRLAVLGMDFCNELHAGRATQATPGTTTTRQDAADARATARTFEGLARTIRFTLALETRLRDARRARAAAAEKTLLDTRLRELNHRMQPALHAAPTTTRLHHKILAQLSDWQAEQDLTLRSVDHAIARICRDCAITPPPGTAATHCRSP